MKNHTKLINKPISWLFYLTSLVFSAYLLASFFNFPATDDFAYALRTINTNIIDLQINYYFSFCGRYFATFVTHLFTGLNNFHLLCAWSPLLIISLHLISFNFLLKSAAGRLNYKNKTIINFLSLLGIAAYFIALPSPAQSLYWVTGAHVYSLANILTYTILGLILLPKQNRPTEFFTNFSLGLLFLALAGSSEITAVLGSTLTMLALLLLFKYQAAFWYKRIVFSFISVFTGSLIALLAPGNQIRMDTGAAAVNQNKLIFALVSAVKAGFVFLAKQNFFYPPILIFLTIFLIFFLITHYKNKLLAFNKYSKNIFSILLPLGLIIYVIFASFFLTAWGGYDKPPLRVFSLPIGICLPMLFWLAYNTAGYLAAHFKKINMAAEKLLTKTVFILIILELFIIIKFAYNTVPLFKYAELTQARYKIIKNVKNKQQATLYLPSAPHPWPVFHEDILTPNDYLKYPDHTWKNDTFAQYFQLKQAYLRENNYINPWDIQTDNKDRIYLITLAANIFLFMLYILLILPEIKKIRN